MSINKVLRSCWAVLNKKRTSDQLLCYVSVPRPEFLPPSNGMKHLRCYTKGSRVGGVCLRVCVTAAQPADFTVHVLGPHKDKETKGKTETQHAFLFCFHFDILESLESGFVFSNQRQIDDNIWRLAEVGHFSMRISLEGLARCGLHDFTTRAFS